MSAATDLLAACQDYLNEQRTVFDVLAKNQTVVERLQLAVANLESRLLVLEGGATATASATPAMTLASISAISSSVVHATLTYVGVPTGSVAYLQHASNANTATGPWTVDLNATAVAGARVVTITGLAAATGYELRAYFSLNGVNLVTPIQQNFNTSAGASVNPSIQTIANTEIPNGPTGSPGPGSAVGGGGYLVKEGPSSTWGTYEPFHKTSGSSSFTRHFWTSEWAYASLGQTDCRLQPWHMLAERASAAYGIQQPPNANHLMVGIAARHFRAAYYANGSWYPLGTTGDITMDLGEKSRMESLFGGAGRWDVDTSSDGVSPRVRQLYNGAVSGPANVICNHAAAGPRVNLSAATISAITAVVCRFQARVEPLVEIGGTTAHATASTYLMHVGIDPYPTNGTPHDAPNEPDQYGAVIFSRLVPIGTTWTDVVGVDFTDTFTATYMATIAPLPTWFTVD